MLPNFVGIGVPRGGTTWLHELLAEHPQIYVPTRRKEVAYFNAYHDRGQTWYENFFQPESAANDYLAVGEITPAYFYGDEVPQRIAEIPTIKRLLLMLRHPVDRLYSQYVNSMRYQGYRHEFERYLKDHPEKKQQSFYARPLKNYLQYFALEQIQTLITEEALADPKHTGREICEFLGVDADAMPSVAGNEKVNASSIPRFRKAFALAANTRVFLRKHDLDWIVSLGRTSGLKRLLLGKQKQQPKPMQEHTRQLLEEDFADDIAEVEEILDRRIDIWHNAAPARESEVCTSSIN